MRTAREVEQLEQLAVTEVSTCGATFLQVTVKGLDHRGARLPSPVELTVVFTGTPSVLNGLFMGRITQD
jgi:hypothetical protein